MKRVSPPIIVSSEPRGSWLERMQQRRTPKRLRTEMGSPIECGLARFFPRPEPLLFVFLRLGHEVAAPCLNVHAFAIYIHPEAVIGAIGLDAVEGKLENVHN